MFLWPLSLQPGPHRLLQTLHGRSRGEIPEESARPGPGTLLRDSPDKTSSDLSLTRGHLSQRRGSVQPCSLRGQQGRPCGTGHAWHRHRPAAQSFLARQPGLPARSDTRLCRRAFLGAQSSLMAPSPRGAAGPEARAGCAQGPWLFVCGALVRSVPDPLQRSLTGSPTPSGSEGSEGCHSHLAV